MSHTYTPFTVYLASLRDRVMLARHLSIEVALADAESLEEICNRADVLLDRGQALEAESLADQALLQVEAFASGADTATQERLTEMRRHWGVKQNTGPSRPQ